MHFAGSTHVTSDALESSRHWNMVILQQVCQQGNMKMWSMMALAFFFFQSTTNEEAIFKNVFLENSQNRKSNCTEVIQSFKENSALPPSCGIYWQVPLFSDYKFEYKSHQSKNAAWRRKNWNPWTAFISALKRTECSLWLTEWQPIQWAPHFINEMELSFGIYVIFDVVFWI